MKAKNIKWDTDGDMEAFGCLPQEVTLLEKFNYEDYLKGDESGKDEFLEEISDWLSDEYGLNL